LHNVIKMKLQNGSRKLWTERTVTELRLLCLRSTAANGEKQRKVIRIAGLLAKIWTHDNVNMKQDSYSLTCNVQHINSHILSQELLKKGMSIEFTVATPCSLIPMSVVLTFCDRPFKWYSFNYSLLFLTKHSKATDLVSWLSLILLILCRSLSAQSSCYQSRLIASFVMQ